MEDFRIIYRILRFLRDSMDFDEFDVEGFTAERHHLAACILTALEEMVRAFPRQAPQWLARYRSHCLTPGRRVAFQDGPEQRTGTAVAVDDRFSLVIRGDDGVMRTLSSGTVTLI